MKLNKVIYMPDCYTGWWAACFACWTSANALHSPSGTAPSGRKLGFPLYCVSNLHGKTGIHIIGIPCNIVKRHIRDCRRWDVFFFTKQCPFFVTLFISADLISAFDVVWYLCSSTCAQLTWTIITLWENTRWDSRLVPAMLLFPQNISSHSEHSVDCESDDGSAFHFRIHGSSAVTVLC